MRWFLALFAWWLITGDCDTDQLDLECLTEADIEP